MRGTPLFDLTPLETNRMARRDGLDVSWRIGYYKANCIISDKKRGDSYSSCNCLRKLRKY